MTEEQKKQLAKEFADTHIKGTRAHNPELYDSIHRFSEISFIEGMECMRKYYSQKSAERKRELRKDPAYREAENARRRELRNTEEYRAKRRAAYAAKRKEDK